MTAFSAIDMGEVTRLTQAGRLAEAMALLQGRKVAEATPGSPGAAGEGRSSRPTIDMVAPSQPGGAWTAPGFAEGAFAKAKGVPDLAEAMKAFGLRFPAPGGAGLGAGAPQAKTVQVPRGARFEDRTFVGEAGNRTYKVFVPSGYTGQALPLVVLLHGCTQNPDDFAAGTRMNDLAEAQTFLVAYPRQPQSANLQKCWNWFNAADQVRDGGEPALIAGIARQVAEEFSVDRGRIYVAGLSAGGAAAAILAETYPDLFAAVGVHSGLACGAARDMPSAFAAMNGGGAVLPKGGGPVVPTIVFHGDGDRTVHPVNADHVVAQAAPAGALRKAVSEGRTAHGMSFTRTVQTDETGRDVVEQWVLHGAGHAWSGGSASGTYTDPRGPDASSEMVRFFLSHTKPAHSGTEAGPRH